MSFFLCPVQKRSVFWPKLRNAAGHAVSCICLPLVPPKSEWTSGINSLCASCINAGTLKPDFPLVQKFQKVNSLSSFILQYITTQIKVGGANKLVNLFGKSDWVHYGSHKIWPLCGFLELNKAWKALQLHDMQFLCYSHKVFMVTVFIPTMIMF